MENSKIMANKILIRTAICSAVAVLMFVAPRDSVWADIADSPWPTIHGNSRMSQSTDLNGDGTAGRPDGPNERSGVEVGQKWVKTGMGPCVVNVSIGTGGKLYYVNGGKLYKIDPANGNDAVSPITLLPTEAPYAINQPLITLEGGVDKIYVGTRGRVTKYNANLTVDTSWSEDGIVELNWVDDDSTVVDMVVTGGMIHSAESDAIIFTAQGSFSDPSGPFGTWLYALSPSNGSILSSMDFATTATNYSVFDDYEQIADFVVNNTVAIGPNQNSSGDEMVYVVSQRHLAGIGFDTSTRTFASMEWLAHYYDEPGGIAEQSGSSPTVSPNGDRVYIVTGYDNTSSPTDYPVLQSYNTGSGGLEVESADIPTRSLGSVIVEYDSDRSGNMIYVNTFGGRVYGFFETIGTGSSSDTLKCRWRTHADYHMTGANLGMAGKMLYTPFFIQGEHPSYGHAGGFDTSMSTMDCNGTNGCFSITCPGASPNWEESLGLFAIDGCTRSIGYENSTGQVYFGTGTKLFSFEEAAAP